MTHKRVGWKQLLHPHKTPLYESLRSENSLAYVSVPKIVTAPKELPTDGERGSCDSEVSRLERSKAGLALDTTEHQAPPYE